MSRAASTGVTGSADGQSGVDSPTSGRALYFAGPEAVRIEPEAVPDPGPDEVLVETRVSAVSSGTELLIYRGEMPRDLPADESIDALGGDLTYPLKYGYATVGEVAVVGTNVDDDWQGRTVFAFNPHESRFVTDPATLVPVPDDVSPATAALLPTAETATTLVMDGRPRVGERVVVFGAGMVGLVTTSILAEFPLARLTVVEPVPHRREMAATLGADETLAPDQATRVAERGDPPGADLAYELSGQPATLDDAIDAVGYDGRVVVGSWYGDKTAPIELGGTFHRDRIELVSSQVSTIDPARRGRWDRQRRFDTAVEWLDRIDCERLISHRIPFDKAATAYDLLDAGDESVLQVVLMY